MIETAIDVYKEALPIIVGALGAIFTVLLPVALLGGLDSDKKLGGKNEL